MQPETKMLFDQLAADVDQAFQAARSWERQAKDWEERWKQATARAERAEKLVVTHFIARQQAERHTAELAQALAVAEEAKTDAERWSRANAYRTRKLIAHTQALIAAHRHPHMYDVAGVISDAEAGWKEINDLLLQEGV